REQIRENWLQFIGTWDAPRRTLEYQIVESDRVGSVARRLISYQSERDVMAEAYLLTPRWTAGRVPGVVIFHSTVGYTIRQVAGGRRASHWHRGSFARRQTGALPGGPRPSRSRGCDE